MCYRIFENKYIASFYFLISKLEKLILKPKLKIMKKNFVVILLAILASSLTYNTMAQKNYASRDEIPKEYKWSFNDIYADWETWEKELTELTAQLDEVVKFKGILAKDVKNLIALQKLQEELMKRAYKVYQYVGLQYTVDTKNMELFSKVQKVQLLFAQFSC